MFSCPGYIEPKTSTWRMLVAFTIHQITGNPEMPVTMSTPFRPT